jgi:hypothetical protein
MSNSGPLQTHSILRYHRRNVSKNITEPLPNDRKNEQNGGFGCLCLIVEQLKSSVEAGNICELDASGACLSVD